MLQIKRGCIIIGPVDFVKQMIYRRDKISKRYDTAKNARILDGKKRESAGEQVMLSELAIMDEILCDFILYRYFLDYPGRKFLSIERYHLTEALKLLRKDDPKLEITEGNLLPMFASILLPDDRKRKVRFLKDTIAEDANKRKRYFAKDDEETLEVHEREDGSADLVDSYGCKLLNVPKALFVISPESV